MSNPTPKASLNIALATVSDTRTLETDTAGQALVDMITQAGHTLFAREIVTDNRYALRALISQWIWHSDIEIILTTGGTGLTGRDVTPEALQPLFDKHIEGFGELFRWLSYQSVKTSTIQSRAIGGVANGKVIFCLPGSPGACRDAWEGIIVHQLNKDHKPCNLPNIMHRLPER